MSGAKSTERLRTFGPAVIRLRIDAGLSQQELADAVGCPLLTIQRIESRVILPDNSLRARLIEFFWRLEKSKEPA